MKRVNKAGYLLLSFSGFSCLAAMNCQVPDLPHALTGAGLACSLKEMYVDGMEAGCAANEDELSRARLRFELAVLEQGMQQAAVQLEQLMLQPSANQVEDGQFERFKNATLFGFRRFLDYCEEVLKVLNKLDTRPEYDAFMLDVSQVKGLIDKVEQGISNPESLAQLTGEVGVARFIKELEANIAHGLWRCLDLFQLEAKKRLPQRE